MPATLYGDVHLISCGSNRTFPDHPRVRDSAPVVAAVLAAVTTRDMQIQSMRVGSRDLRALLRGLPERSSQQSAGTWHGTPRKGKHSRCAKVGSLRIK